MEEKRLKRLLVGIDVGGTNTDSVLLNPEQSETGSRGVITYNKTATTAHISEGINKALTKLFEEAKTISPKEVLAITIGTTHFINAVVERDESKLERVAVIRLCSSYTRGMPPFSDFPAGLKEIVECYRGYVDGGNRVDGSEIRALDEKALYEHAMQIKKAGIKAVAIVGIFSIMCNKHEIRAAEIFKEVNPEAKVVISSEVSGIGFLTRENACILNASVMKFAGNIIRSLSRSIKSLGFSCPVFLTQNDGTVLAINEALKVPIRTFSSGATNSMRGAAFLCQREKEIAGQSMIVIDIGGTTTDVGLLLPSGFPRQVSSHSIIGGVLTNFNMPHVESIGLGGGSIVRDSMNLTVGPDSLGAEILAKAVLFGGKTTTASDITVAMNAYTEEEIYMIGDPSMVKSKYSSSLQHKFEAAVKKKLEVVIDRMKTSPENLPILLVGGGSFIAPKKLKGTSKVFHPPYFQVANAIGAAMGKFSESIQRIVAVSSDDEKNKIVNELIQEVTNKLEEKGGLRESIRVVDLITDPVPYVERTYSFKVKVVGDPDYHCLSKAYGNLKYELPEDFSDNKDTNKFGKKMTNREGDKIIDLVDTIEHQIYKPRVTTNREWIISEVDLVYIRIGTYLLGCGGGGTSYPAYLQIRNMLREGASIRVISPDDITRYSNGEGSFIPVGFAGSPTVSDEQLSGTELEDAAEALRRYIGRNFDGVFPLEIGGGNGLQGLYCGSSSKLGLPVVDADFMGRAYPTHYQTLPSVYSDEPVLSLASMSDGNGNKFLITEAQSMVYVEKIARAALAEVGSHIGVVNTPMTAAQICSMTVRNSLSVAWRMGKAVRIARQRHEIDKMPERILESIGGKTVGRKIFMGKIIGVEKKLFKGHVYGEVVIENEATEKMCIPFKNENILAKVQKNSNSDWEVVCSVPDLISVCYADSGEAVGTPEYRYGILVFVIAFAPNNLWTGTEKAIDVGGPKGFGPVFEDIQYQPIGKYVKPISVIDEFA